MEKFLGIFIGGGLGASLRYAISLATSYSGVKSLWLGTLLSNLIGCGILFFSYKSGENSLALRVGFLGALTTFSTMSLEMFQALAQRQLFTFTIIFALNFLGAAFLWLLIHRSIS